MGVLNQGNFSSGQITKNLLGKTNSQAYNFGLKYALNCYVTVEGSIRKRPGTRHIAPLFLEGKARLVAHEGACIVLGEDYMMVYVNGVPLVNKTTSTITYDSTKDIYSITNAKKWDILRQGIRYAVFPDANGDYQPQKFSRDPQTDVKDFRTVTGYNMPQVGNYETIYKFEFGQFPFTEQYQYMHYYSQHWRFGFFGGTDYWQDWDWATRTIYQSIPTDRLNYFSYNGKLVIYSYVAPQGQTQKALTFEEISITGLPERPSYASLVANGVFRYGDRSSTDYHAYSRNGIPVDSGNFTRTPKTGTGLPTGMNSISSFNIIFQQRLAIIQDSNTILFSTINDYTNFTTSATDGKAGFFIRFDNEFLITAIGQLESFLIVGSATTIYRVFNRGGSGTVNGAEPFSVEKISNIGLAPIMPVLHDDSLICVTNDRNGIVAISYSPNMGMSVSEVAESYELFREYGGITEIRLLTWGHPLIICGTHSGQLIQLNISEGAVAPCPWRFDYGFVKDFCVTKQDFWSDTLYLLVVRGGEEYLEIMTKPLDILSKEQWFSRYEEADIRHLYLAQQKEKLDDYYYRYYAQVMNTNTFCDASVMINTHRDVDLEFNGKDLLSVKARTDDSTGNLVKMDYFTKDMAHNGYFNHNGDAYEVLEYIDTTNIRVKASSKDSLHWVAYNGSCNFYPYIIDKLEHLYYGSPNIVTSSAVTQAFGAGNSPILMPIDQVSRELKVSIDGKVRASGHNEFNIGLPYKTLIVTNPVAVSGDILKRRTVTGGVIQCIQTGQFKAGANIHETYYVQLAEVDEIQYYECDIGGVIRYGYRFVIESSDPVNLRILTISMTEKSV